MECHLEAKLEVTIFAYSLEKGMSMTDEIRGWQVLGHNIYQQYLRIDLHCDLLCTFTGKRELGRLRKRWNNLNLEKGHNVSNVVQKLTSVTLLL
jgi:hypothetical protein